MAEDSWEKASLEEVRTRFGVIEFRTRYDEHKTVITRIQQSSAEPHVVALTEAKDIIRAYRLCRRNDSYRNSLNLRAYTNKNSTYRTKTLPII